MKKWVLGLVPIVILCGGFRFHEADFRRLKPELPSVGGPPGPGCGTGTTCTWIAVTSTKDVPIPAMRVAPLIERDLLSQGYVKSKVVGRNAVFVRSFESGAQVAVLLRDNPSEGTSTICCSVQAPRVTWYGLRVPAP